MILIESPDGKEKCLVESLDGYDGWNVIAEGVEKPAEHCVWCDNDGAWKEDAALKARAELLVKVRDPEQLADLLVDILARLQSPE